MINLESLKKNLRPALGGCSAPRAALSHGATPREIMEAIWVAAEMRAGGSFPDRHNGRRCAPLLWTASHGDSPRLASPGCKLA
jgi:hypothetical protein